MLTGYLDGFLLALSGQGWRQERDSCCRCGQVGLVLLWDRDLL